MRGRAVEWDLQGRPVLVIGVTLDIDAAKHAEAHMRQSEHMLETAASGAANLGVPGEDGRGTVRQGMLEASNVNVVEELVDMIECQRAYEVNSKMISATDDMLKYVNQNI